MFKLFKNFKPKDIFFSIIAILGIVTQVWLDLKMPDYMSEITKLVETEGSEMSDILTNGGYMMACAAGSMIAAIIVGYITSNIAASLSRNVRKQLFTKVENLSTNEVKKFSVPSLVTRATNDITQIQMFVSMGMQLVIKAPITAVWAISKIINKSWQWSAATAVAVLILIVVVVILITLVVPKFKIIQKLIDRINSSTRENITGIRVVRAFNAESYQEKKFAQTNHELTNLQLFTQRMLSIMSPMMYFVMYLLSLAVYVIGAILMRDAADPYAKLEIFSDMIVFSAYGTQVIMSFLMLAFIFMIVPRAQVSATRINEVLETEISVKDGHRNIKETSETGTVEFKNVSFKYPDAEEYLIKDISFKVNQGETIAFIGSTGSGKSTLINLVPRFYDATEGEVLVDGVNVKDCTFKSLNNKLGYIPQKPVLFAGDIKGNIAFGENGKGRKTEDQIKSAIAIAQGTDFVEKLDKQYDAHVAQGGTNFSGGQKQRLAIARAIARDPEIYIFDDSFSALDYKTDANLRKDLRKHTKNATCMIVAQRIGTIMNADRIVVLDQGRCVGQGTHKELLENCEVYRQIAQSQLSKEEL